MRNDRVRRYNQTGAVGGRNVSSAYAIPEITKKEQEQDEREYLAQGQRKVRELSRKKQKEAQVFNMRQVAVLTASVILFTLLCAAYLVQASAYYENRTQMVKIEKQLQTLSRENALLSNQESMNIDYNEVYEFAIAEGMVEPGKQQIVTYKQNTYEYVSKTGEIPNE